MDRINREHEISTELAVIREIVQDNKNEIKSLKYRLFGNGGSDGYMVRLDRVEQRWKALGWALTPIYVAVIGLVVAAVWGGGGGS